MFYYILAIFLQINSSAFRFKASQLCYKQLLKISLLSVFYFMANKKVMTPHQVCTWFRGNAQITYAEITKLWIASVSKILKINPCFLLQRFSTQHDNTLLRKSDVPRSSS